MVVLARGGRGSQLTIDKHTRGIHIVVTLLVSNMFWIFCIFLNMTVKSVCSVQKICLRHEMGQRTIGVKASIHLANLNKEKLGL